MKHDFRVSILALLSLALTGICVELDLSRSLVWGPGLSADFFMPVRYFYVQLVDRNGENVTESIGKDSIVVKIETNEGDSVRAYKQILDLNDGSYIVRYRLFHSYPSLVISLVHAQDGKHLGGSPFLVDGPLNAERCRCPEQDLSKWYASMGCRQTYTQIELDMKKFTEKIDMNVMQKMIVNTFNQEYSQSLCNYVIKDNQLFRKCYGKHVGFHIFSDAILSSILRKVKLPDLEFFMNLGDWPLSEKKSMFMPIVSWCGSKSAHDLILPTYELTESVIEMMGRQGLDLQTVLANTGSKWDEKIPKAFWRGRDSRQERLDLVLMARNNSEIIDAGLTNMFFFTDEKETLLYGPLTERVPFFDFFKYKYQLNLDGTVAAYRFPFLLAGDSAVFKQDSDFYEHFYADVEPFVHYIPFKRDLSNLLEVLRWATKHDKQVKKISRNGQEFAKENLTPNHVFCYHVKFLEAYAKHFKSTVLIRPEMAKVEDEPIDGCICDGPKRSEL